MKKILLHNRSEYYEFKYIISKKKWAVYHYVKQNNYRSLRFLKNYVEHRPCDIGPQFKDMDYISYVENNKYHNLYGYAYINKYNDIQEHWIYNYKYNEYEFYQYISIYNNLSYKRIY